MTSLVELVTWKRIPVPAGAAAGQVEFAVGQVGGGKPVALLVAGIHGDEGPWGSWAIHKLLRQTSADDLRGALRIVPVANPLAMEADARNAPLDMLDLNRVFPGDSAGSYTERVAALLAQQVEGIDVVIDIHGGGSWCVNAFAFRFAGSEALAEAVGAPFLVDAPDRAVTLTGYARTRGAKVAAIEMGGRSDDEEHWAERIAIGLRRVLGVAGSLTPGPADQSSSIPVGPATVLRPSRGGIFVPEVRQRDIARVVPGNAVLGRLLDPVTHAEVEIFTAPFAQTALLLLRPMMARIEGGAMTYVVAQPRTPMT
jgi:predicted deacylase